MQSNPNSGPVSSGSPVKAQSSLTSLLQQHQAAQQQQMQQQQQQQQQVVATNNHVVLTSVNGTDESMSIDDRPAGQIARSLSIPIFAAAAAGNANGNSNGTYSTPNKRTKTSSGTPQHTPPTQPASALTLMMQQTAAAAAAAGSSAGMSPGTYYRGVAAINSQPVHRSSMITVPTVTPQSNLQKRRNSSTSLHLSPHHGPQAIPINASMSSPSQQPMQYRKPPAYPSNPSTPASASRSIPINITSGNKSGSSSAVMSPSPGAGAMTPPGTPPVIPMPRAVMPANPLTPALAPDRSIAITNAQGNVIQRVNSKEMMKAMDNAEEVILPAAAVDQHHHRHKHHHQHKTRSMNQHAAQQQQQAASVQPQPHSATAASPQPSPEPPNASPQPLAPITPVKHLVKLSSLSSLSSLITPSAASPSASPSPQPSSSPSMSPQPPQATGTDSPTMGSRTHSPATTSTAHPSSSPPVIPPTYIILDIDETIHINAHSPCLMMCEKGLEMYQKIISSHGNYKHVSYTQKSQLTKTLQTALQSKRTVEHHTSDLLNTLQAASHPKDGVPPSNNIKIFGLTARFSHMASTTRKELLKLNIDLEKSSPFPMSVRKKNAHAQKDGSLQFSPQQSPTHGTERSLTPSPVLCASVTPLGSSPSLTSLHLPASSQAEYFPDVSWVDHPSFGTDARYQQGVIYTNACEKGPVLQRFLEFLWAKIEEDNHEMLEQHEAAQQLYFQHHMSGLDSPAVTSITNLSPAGHSMLNNINNNHAVSSPIAIGGAGTAVAAATDLKPKNSPGSTPSPPSGDMSLLAAASNLANRKGTKSSARRNSRSTDLLSLPDSSPHADPMHIHSPSASPTASPPPPPMLTNPVMSHLPTRIIFIDDRLQNCFSVYESLSAQTLFDKFYNHPTKRPHLKHVPHVLEVYTCHYVPVELAQHAPTNQTKADAAATAAHGDQPDMELIETQIHHFLTHGEILNDPKGREMVARIKSDASKALALAQEKVRLEREEQAKAAALAFVAQEQAAAAAAAATAMPAPSPSPTSDMMDVSHGGSAMEDDTHPAPSASQADTIMAVTPRHCSVTVQ